MQDLELDEKSSAPFLFRICWRIWRTHSSMRIDILVSRKEMFKMEIWKPIKRFPSYNCSDLGRIMNVRTQKILRPYLDDRGYLQVCLRKNNRRCTVRLHRLVADTFLGEQPGMDARHKNGDRSDNRADNIYWSERSETLIDIYENGGRSLMKATPVRVVELDREFCSVAQCARELMVDRKDIFEHLSGFKDDVKGYHIERINHPRLE